MMSHEERRLLKLWQAAAFLPFAHFEP